jgi:2-polyprenyl-6-methoxyphenol hydroxylase-like FAD-dependent oxidoreductase
MVTVPHDTDVVIVGGGPIGLAAAIAARQNGLAVVLADRAAPPIDKACGEGLMPDGVAALRQLGVNFPASQGAPFRGIRFVEDRLSAQALFRHGPGHGLQRPQLHRLLVERAQALGITLRWQSHVQVLASNVVAIDGYSVRCRWIVGADGMHSPLRRSLAIEPRWHAATRIGLRQHYRLVPWTDLVEVHWHRLGQAYVTPVAPDRICVAVIGAAGALDMASLAECFPTLAQRLRGAPAADAPRGSPSTSTTWHHVTSDNFALVGDASGAVDAVTGEGMALGFRQALALTSALAAGDLRQYERVHRQLMRKPLAMARLLLLMGRHAALRRGVLHVLAAQPRVFEKLLALHVGHHPALPPDLPRLAAE